jgi:hypothetical protein
MSAESSKMSAESSKDFIRLTSLYALNRVSQELGKKQYLAHTSTPKKGSQKVYKRLSFFRVLRQNFLLVAERSTAKTVIQR